MSEVMPITSDVHIDTVNENMTEPIEPIAEDTQIVVATTTTTDLTPPTDADISKKKRASFGIFKAALFMLRTKPKENEKKKMMVKQNSLKPSTNASWTKLVGSMRPLHMQEVTESPPSSIAPDSPPSMMQRVHQPASPAASSSTGTMSKYASASSLRDLYNSSDDEEEEQDPDVVFDALTGDEMIDSKAEEFIAQFYKQIQLQNHHRHHNHHSRFN